MHLNSRKKKTILGLAGLGFMALSIATTTILLQSRESVDTRSGASGSGNIEYGALVTPNFLLGNNEIPNEDKYVDVLEANFDWVLNHRIKIQMIHGKSRDEYSWEENDNVVKWAKEHNKKVKFHTLIWHSDKINNRNDQVLDWYDDLPTDQDRLVALEEHVKTILEHYKGDVIEYDLVNHAVHHVGGGNYMNTGKNIDEVIVLAFKWANEVDPDATYVINGGSVIIENKESRDIFIKRINDANSRLPEGSKIEVAGIMGHLGWCTGEIPSLSVIKNSIDEIHQKTGLEVEITELDLSYAHDAKWVNCGDREEIDPNEPFKSKEGDNYNTWFDYQGKAYSDLYDLFRNHEAINRVFTWGFYDGAHWRTDAGYFWGPETGKDFEPKPAYIAIKELTCTPLCSARQCGYDGCGGTCGECSDGESCSSSYQCTGGPPSGDTMYGTLVRQNNVFDGTYSKEKSAIYLDTVNANYDAVTSQYARLDILHKNSRDNYEWERIDPLINWANENNKEILLHNLIHHSSKVGDPSTSVLDWYDELPSDAERLVALEEFVRTVVKHYDGKVDMYHLINHFLYQDGDGNYMNTGKDIEELMVLAFQWANDESDETKYIANAPSGGMYVEAGKNLLIERVNRVNSQLQDGDKIDAIGIMGHFGRCSGEIPDINRIKSYLTEIHNETSLPIYVSELDIAYDHIEGTCDNPKVVDPYASFTTEAGTEYDSWFDYQGEAYKELYDMFTEHEAVTHVFTWGFYDGEHWRKHGGLFYGPDEGSKAEDFEPKPAYLNLKGDLCTPLCSDRECGYDGCGGVCSSCPAGRSCSTEYQCVDTSSKKVSLVIEKDDGGTKISKGDELKMDIKLTGNQFEVDSATVDFSYDQGKLSFLKITYPDSGVRFKRKGVEDTSNPGIIKISRNSNGEVLTSSELKVATVHFSTKGLGQADFTFTSNAKVTLKNENILEDKISAKITIEEDGPPDDPPEDQLGCKNFKISKPKVISKNEQITISVDGILSQEIELFVSAGGQTNRNSSDLVCEAENTSDPEYSYYCAGTKAWFQLKKASGTTTAITTTFADLEKIIDDGILNGNPYSGDLDDIGIVVAANVRKFNPTDICSSNIARNDGNGVSWEDGAWDKTCSGGCYGTIGLTDYVPPDEPPPDDPPPDDPPPDDPPYVPPNNGPDPINPPPNYNNGNNDLPATAEDSGQYKIIIGIVILSLATLTGGYELVRSKIKVTRETFNRDF